MTARPLISTLSIDSGNKLTSQKTALPAVFGSQLRLDIVQKVFSDLNKNRRQAHGVDPRAGMKHSAESWGTGRAVARIPRVSGSGTHRSGQAAFGNMTRKGRMFAPLKIWRRWNRRVNIKQRRQAIASALAASAVVPLVMARGHRIEEVTEVPMVVEDKFESYEKTKDLIAALKRLHLAADIDKVKNTKVYRSGKGKMRNRRYKLRKGPLFVYLNENAKLVKAARNLLGVEVCNVKRLGLKELAPGGQMGRMIVWTESAFKALDGLFGTFRRQSKGKSGFKLPHALMTNADLARIINSNEVQSVLQPKKEGKAIHSSKQKKNALKNPKLMAQLNPADKLFKDMAKKQNAESRKQREEKLKQKRKITAEKKKEIKERKLKSKAWMKNIEDKLQEGNQENLKWEKHRKNELLGIDDEVEEQK